MFNMFIDITISHSLSNLIGEYKIYDLRKYKTQAYVNEFKPFQVSLERKLFAKLHYFSLSPQLYDI